MGVIAERSIAGWPSLYATPLTTTGAVLPDGGTRNSAGISR
jgi:hypothetical protein